MVDNIPTKWVCRLCDKETDEVPYFLDDIEVCKSCYESEYDNAERMVNPER